MFLLDIMSDVLRENVGHGAQNVGHVQMSDDFSYTLYMYVCIYVCIYMYICTCIYVLVYIDI